MDLATRAEALFMSTLQPSSHPTPIDLGRAIQCSLRAFATPGNCAACCAAEFGDHPDIALSRMRWALSVASLAVGVD
jgi:hypothetical protein